MQPQILLLFTLILMGFLFNRKESTNIQLWTLWGVGFIILFAFDLFMEGVVFDWLKWNGTEKNDWFFVLWWALNLLWAVFGSGIIKRKFKKLKF